MDKMKSKRKGKKKVIFIVKVVTIVLLTLLLITLIALPPFIMNDMVNKHMYFNEVHKASEFGLTAKELTLTTSDHYDISAFEVYTEKPKAVIMMISGIQNPSVTEFFDHAKLFKENGYATILFDMRAHGKSEGDTVCLGYKEVRDTRAVVDYIKSEEKYKGVPIVVFGVSMGGATAINSTGEIKDIDGLISLSAYSSWDDCFCDNMVNMGAPKAYAWLQRPFVKLYTDFKYGFNTAGITPEQEIKKLGDRPALLIHSRGDSQVPYASFKRIMKHAPAQTETWVRDGDLHFIVKDNDNNTGLETDKEYTDKILGFLNKHFGGTSK